MEPHEPDLPQIAAIPKRLSSSLAAEIVEKILDELHPSKNDFSNCSVVCRSWLPRCRYHLFNEVVYRPGFFRFLYSPYCSGSPITSYIRKIQFTGPVTSWEEKSDDPTCAVEFRRLMELDFRKMSWSSLDVLHPALTATLFTSFKELRKLSLLSVRFPSFAIFTGTLNHFTLLGHLSLDNISWDDTSLGPDGDEARVTKCVFAHSLRGLSISFSHTAMILNYLRSGLSHNDNGDKRIDCAQQFPLLASLSLSDVSPGDADVVGAFISSCSTMLERLELGFLVVLGDSRFNEAITQLIDLSFHVNLTTISINGIALFQFPFPNPPSPSVTTSDSPTTDTGPYGWISAFLSTVRPGSLRELGLHVWLSAETQLDLIDWSQLAERMASLSISQLRIIISGTNQNPITVESWMTKRLTTWDPSTTSIHLDFKL